MPKQKVSRVKNNKNLKIYLVPHTHYDAIWVFTKEDYFYINIDLILKKVVDLLEKEIDYKFLIEQTYLLEELEKRYPEFFKKITRYVKEKRIEIADGEYLMADTMLPQGETLIREIMFGKQFVKKKFGVDVPVMWQADSFGLNAQLPQIYRKSGYKYLAFRRGCPEKKPSEFIWEGLDGTRIISHFMPLGYRAGLNLSKLGENYIKMKNVSATDKVLMPSGSGVTMPQEETVEVVKNWNKKNKTKIKIATPLEFFKRVEKYEKKLKIRKGEMYSGKYSKILPDVASSRIWLKKNLRKYETKLVGLEKFCTINSFIDSYYPEELRECWKKVLFLGFHDVVPGTGMDKGYEEAKQHIGFLNTKIKYLIPSVLKSIVENDSNNETFGDLAVFNPLSWEVSNWVEVNLKFNKGQVFKIEGVKNRDEVREVEVIRFARYEDESLKRIKIGFVANVPPTGYKVYKIIESITKTEKNSFIKIIGNTIENKFFKLRFSSDTGLIEVFKNNKRICKGNELVVEEESGDLYYHRERLGIPLKTERGEGVKYGSFKVNNFWIDKSPLRRVINIESDYYSLRWPYRLTDKTNTKIWRQKFIKFKKKIIIYKDIPRIDFLTYVENNHPMIRLRVKFDTNIKKTEYTCETQFGAIKRKTNLYYLKPKGWVEEPSGVFPSLRWIDYSDKEEGLTVINKGNPENEVRDKTIYLTLMRSVEMLSSDGESGPVIPVSDAREIKKYNFTYSIYPHKKNWKKAKSYKQGYEFNYSLIALQLQREKKYKRENSFLKVSPDNVIVTALKKSEDEKGIIIRFYEAQGKKTETTLTLFKKPEEVQVVNLIEEKDKEFDKKIEIKENEIKLNTAPFEIVSLKVKL